MLVFCLQKNGWYSGGVGVFLNALCEVPKHRKRDQMIKWNSYQADLTLKM